LQGQSCERGEYGVFRDNRFACGGCEKNFAYSMQNISSFQINDSAGVTSTVFLAGVCIVGQPAVEANLPFAGYLARLSVDFFGGGIAISYPVVVH
jgi:hypothetical protein